MAYSVQSRPKKAREVKNKVRSMLIIFFDIKATGKKEFVLAGQAVNSAHYCDILRCDCVQMCEDFAPNFGDKRSGCCITSFSREVLTKNNVIVVLHQPHFSLFFRLKIKQKDMFFNTIEEIDTESQEVLNTLTENEFRNESKKKKNGGNSGNDACASI
jgi:hypothetical protein